MNISTALTGVCDLNKVVKSHYVVFPIAITEKVTVYALLPGSNHSSFTAGMMQATRGQQQQQQLLQGKINMVKLLTDMVENRLHETSVLLEVTSVDPVVQKTPFAYSISKVYMGIPGNLDLQKRKIAQNILSRQRLCECLFYDPKWKYLYW